MQYVFISYSREDGHFAEILSEKIQSAGFVPWKDQELRAGEEWRNKIDQAIKDSFVLISVLTPQSRTSGYLNYEWAFALGAGVVVVPLLLNLKESDLHPRLEPLQHFDFTDCKRPPWELLLKRLAELAEAHRPFTICVPWDAPPVIRKAAQALDSLNAEERRNALDSLGQMNHPAAREALAEAVKHPVQEVRILAASRLANLDDPRALPGLVEAVRCRHEEIIIEAGKIRHDLFSRLGKSAVTGLINCLKDEDQSVRSAAAVALGRIGDNAAVPGLIQLIEDSNVGRQAVIALGEIGDSSALPHLEKALRNRAFPYRIEGVRALSQLGSVSIPILLEFLTDKDGNLRHNIVCSLENICDVSAVPALTQVLLNDIVDSVRYNAARVLGKIGDPSSIPALLEAIFDRNGVVQMHAFEALQQLGKPALEGLSAIMKDRNIHFSIRSNAAAALGDIGDPLAIEALLVAIQDQDVRLCISAIRSLGKIGDPASVPALCNLLNHEESDVKEATAYALEEIGTPKAFAAIKAWRMTKRQES